MGTKSPVTNTTMSDETIATPAAEEKVEETTEAPAEEEKKDEAAA
jgi:RNase H-fold protein (predicted Holliday junction resolvase)